MFRNSKGLSGEWVEINYDDIVRYVSGKDPVIRDQADWHVHHPLRVSLTLNASPSVPTSETDGIANGNKGIDNSTKVLAIGTLKFNQTTFASTGIAALNNVPTQHEVKWRQSTKYQEQRRPKTCLDGFLPAPSILAKYNKETFAQ